MSISSAARTLVEAAHQALATRADEVNRLNVFPVPDGDTGTNMSLTMQAVLNDVQTLPADTDLAGVCKAITHGSLMGARGNSGVILSQILRGLCEVVGSSDRLDAEVAAQALERAQTVAFQAIRKPIEGTILTVLRDSASEARRAADDGDELQVALERIVAESFESVKRTPELLPTLKENGVVDAGGYGLAILFEGFVSAVAGRDITVDIATGEIGELHVVPVDDWDDQEYLYCTEFLLHGEGLDSEDVHDFVVTLGGSELVVGEGDTLKVHVHTNEPGTVLSHMTDLGQVSEVHIHNMRMQQAERDAGLHAQEAGSPPAAPSKPFGFVTVASGSGIVEILKSLGADVIVSGGQTMNPSTADLLTAIESVDAESIIVLPNNKNIVMAAQAAAQESSRPAAVVATTSIPQAFSALLAYSGEGTIDEVVDAMTNAAGMVRSGEVTTAVKDAKGKVGDIKAGQVIGISDHEIEAVGDDVVAVATDLAVLLAGDDAETLTVLAGEDLDDDGLSALSAAIATRLPNVDVETHRGEQPLYPVLLSAE